MSSGEEPTKQEGRWLNHISSLLNGPVEGGLDGIWLLFVIGGACLAWLGGWMNEHGKDIERHLNVNEDTEDSNVEYAVEPVIENLPEVALL